MTQVIHSENFRAHCNYLIWKGLEAVLEKQVKIYMLHIRSLGIKSLAYMWWSGMDNITSKWFSKGLWQWLIHCRNTMLGIVHYMRFIWYAWHCRCWRYSRLQVTGCHYTDIFLCVISDNGRDWTQDILNARLVH
jgi:hypothetical protein